MEAKEFFSDKDIQLPLTRVQPDFPAYLGRVLSKFRKLLGQIKGSDPLSLSVLAQARASRRLCRALMRSISSYYEGYPSSAYGIFATAVGPLRARSKIT